MTSLQCNDLTTHTDGMNDELMSMTWLAFQDGRFDTLTSYWWPFLSFCEVNDSLNTPASLNISLMRRERLVERRGKTCHANRRPDSYSTALTVSLITLSQATYCASRSECPMYLSHRWMNVAIYLSTESPVVVTRNIIVDDRCWATIRSIHHKNIFDCNIS